MTIDEAPRSVVAAVDFLKFLDKLGINVDATSNATFLWDPGAYSGMGAELVHRDVDNFAAKYAKDNVKHHTDF